MDDTIYRQDAFDALNGCTEIFLNNLPPTIYKTDAVEAITALQPAQPGWIPCSRELPKKDGDYLVTTHSGQIARYIFIGGSSEEYWRRCATAWMPLPKPWKGEKP